MNKSLQELKKFLRANTLHLRRTTRTGGGHYKAVITDTQGGELHYIMSCTPSDGRARMNIEHDILRHFNKTSTGQEQKQ